HQKRWVTTEFVSVLSCRFTLLVLRYGDSANVTCEVCGHQGTPKFEKSLGKVIGNNTTAVWIVDKMTEWDITSICYYEDKEGKLQATILPVVVYRKSLPEHVSISFVEYNNTLESGKHTLLCSVSDTAPAADLVVTFYRGSIPLDQQNSTRTTKEPESQSFTLSYNITKEDNGAPFWCQAKLELGHEGLQHLPVVRSGNINPIVHCKFLVEKKKPVQGYETVFKQGGRVARSQGRHSTTRPPSWYIEGETMTDSKQTKTFINKIIIPVTKLSGRW
uniref:Ig-like domain-containing protein n=1 Tax=Nothobranchius furzeri TaxID=105023 RepID=A0A8C6M6K9_NOTFU